MDYELLLRFANANLQASVTDNQPIMNDTIDFKISMLSTIDRVSIYRFKFKESSRGR